MKPTITLTAAQANPIRRVGVTLASLLLACALPVAAQHAAGHPEHGQGEHGQDEHAAHHKMMQQAKAPTDALNVEIELRDLELVDQYGEKVKFASDVISDKLVAMTFTYSSCTTVCPVYSALFTKTQDLLGDRMDREVILVTLTLDPTTDVPPRLRREAQKYRAKPGWYFLTGNKLNVDKVLRGLDAYFADFTQHPPMALIGDGRTGTWKRFNGFPEPEKIVALLDELKAARGVKEGK